jgi:hypothetical protein
MKTSFGPAVEVHFPKSVLCGGRESWLEGENHGSDPCNTLNYKAAVKLLPILLQAKELQDLYLPPSQKD